MRKSKWREISRLISRGHYLNPTDSVESIEVGVQSILSQSSLFLAGVICRKRLSKRFLSVSIRNVYSPNSYKVKTSCLYRGKIDAVFRR